jgi:hypothetical protein
MSQHIYNVRMVEGGVQLVLTALNQLPHGQVRGLIDEIATQYQEQKPRAEATPPAPAPAAVLDFEGGEA